MSVPHVFPATPARVRDCEDGDGALTRTYRCEAGHVTAIRWSAKDVSLAITDNDFKIYCPCCNSSRLALPVG
jgi:hypothetical protein